MKTTIVGLPVCVGGREEVLRECMRLVGRGGLVFTLNALMCERAMRCESFANTLRGADVLTVDGVGVKALLRLRGVRTDTLVGVELGEELLREGEHTVALIGGIEGVAERAMAHLLAINPALHPAFAVSGFGHTEEEYISLVRTHTPDVVLVCLGSPRQESLAARLRAESEKTLFLALGGSLDIYSGAKRRAPLVMRRLGLEWLFRSISEPHRIKELPRLVAFLLCAPKMAKNQQKTETAK